MAALVHQAKAAKLARYRRFLQRQAEVRWGPEYQAAIKAVRGEAPSISGPGTLPAARLGRELHAMSWPEKVFGALALYGGAFEVHDQHLFYPTPRPHALACHPIHRVHPWPATEGTLQIAEELGLIKFHPREWVEDEAGSGHWEIGAWVGDYQVFLEDRAGAYNLFWSVKQTREDHGKPGGDSLRRLSPSALARAEARERICARYAEQLGSRIVDVSCEEVPPGVAASLVMLCRAHVDPRVHLLPPSASAELIYAFNEGVGADVPARHLARRVVSSKEHLEAAKALLQVAVWERKVRVDLDDGVYWDQPLAPERLDVLVMFASYFARR